jgi:hypothetical protein
VPSGKFTALAPAFAAVADTVRTTVASAKGSPVSFRAEMSSRMSDPSGRGEAGRIGYIVL